MPWKLEAAARPSISARCRKIIGRPIRSDPHVPFIAKNYIISRPAAISLGRFGRLDSLDYCLSFV